MGRGRVQMKRIENKINRQVTFSKRRSGLLKKAHEISVLCEVEVALIIFSTNGKLYEYSTDSSMERILERYERCSYAERAVATPDTDSQENWVYEYGKLKAKVETLQKTQRHLTGEQLDSLNLKQLQQLEQQLEISWKHVRSRKNQLMVDTIGELQRKEKSLREQNKDLERGIMEKKKANTLAQHSHWEQQSQLSSSSSSVPPFVISGTLPSQNMRNYQQRGAETEEAAQPPVQITSTLLPTWMRHDWNG